MIFDNFSNVRFFDDDGGSTGTNVSATSTNDVTTNTESDLNNSEQQTGINATIDDKTSESKNIKSVKPKFTDIVNDPDYSSELSKLIEKAVGRKHAQLKQTETALNELRNEYAALEPALQTLHEKYMTKTNSELSEKIANDKEIYRAEAIDREMDIETLIEVKRVERENKLLRKNETERQNKARYNEMVRGIVEQSNAIKSKYPNFDLRKESQNETFVKMVLNANIPVETAYKAVHAEEWAQQAEERGRQITINNIHAKSDRPAEVGMGLPTGSKPKYDFEHMTKIERDDLARKVKAGIIKF